MKSLKESNYDGLITLEIIPQDLPKDEEDIKKALREAVFLMRTELT